LTLTSDSSRPVVVRRPTASQGDIFVTSIHRLLFGLTFATMLGFASRGFGAEPGKADADAPKEFKSTESGLKYRVLRKSDGPKPKASSTVKVNYKGWLDDGKEFDSSYKRNEPIEFPLNRVIPGWTEGMQLVGKGGMIELEIPSELGYGARGAPGAIPPNATLHFLVELIDIQ
jgi:FKBP-type peptidyl-prolyl cis-trans isomerase FkpA